MAEMTPQEAETSGKLLGGLVLFGSTGCFIVGYGLYAFVFCVLAGAISFGLGYLTWQKDKEHNRPRILFPITGASAAYAGLFALFYVAGQMGAY